MKHDASSSTSKRKASTRKCWIAANMLADTFRWDAMPEHLVFQSRAVSSTGQYITPSNLPEDRLYSHTQILWSVLRRLQGQTGPSTGTAVTRR